MHRVFFLYGGGNFADGVGGQGRLESVFLGKHFVPGSSAAVTLFWGLYVGYS